MCLQYIAISAMSLYKYSISQPDQRVNQWANECRINLILSPVSSFNYGDGDKNHNFFKPLNLYAFNSSQQHCIRVRGLTAFVHRV